METDTIWRGNKINEEKIFGALTSSLEMTPSSFLSQLKKFPAEPLAFPKKIPWSK